MTHFLTKSWQDDLPILTTVQTQLLLQRLALPDDLEPSLTHLNLLQWRYLCHSVFHNLYLLAGFQGYPAPLSVSDSLQNVLDGHGGPCHVQAVGFLCLLRSLHYSAHFAAAEINAPLDHVVIIVHLAEGSFVCDVGNGHPYRQVFPLETPLEQNWMGWHFRSTPTKSGGLCLQRRIAHGNQHRWKTVYQLDPTPCTFQDFIPSLQKHHQQLGFGPFLQHLRAVRIFEQGVLSLRNACYERYTICGKQTRLVPSLTAASKLLQEVFGISQAPIQQALHVYQSHQAYPWACIPQKPTIHLQVSLSATGIAQHLNDLVQVLIQTQGLISTLLVLENSINPVDRLANCQCIEYLRQYTLSIHYIDDGQYGSSIAVSRRKQVRWLAQYYAQKKKPDLVWMIDDDLAWQHLSVVNGYVSYHSADRLVTELLTYYYTYPHISVLLGGVTGDPPIRPDAVLRTQLFDLLANLEWFAALKPDQTYPVLKQSTHFCLPDYYYDHSEMGEMHYHVPFRWQARRDVGATVREQCLAYLKAATNITIGKAVTRPLLYNSNMPLKPSVLRGGNTIFFDFDVLLAHAYPNACIDGIETRRADMIGASLLQTHYPARIYQAVLPLLHERTQRALVETDQQATWDSLRSEFFGVILARAVNANVDDAFDFKHATQQRAMRIISNLQQAKHYLDTLKQQHDIETEAWWKHDVETNIALQQLLAHLTSSLDIYFSFNKNNQTLLDELLALATDPSTINALQHAYTQLKPQFTQWQHDITALVQKHI